MAQNVIVSGYPKQAVGDIARDMTNRPSHLRLKAQDTISPQSTVGGNGERKIRNNRAPR